MLRIAFRGSAIVVMLERAAGRWDSGQRSAPIKEASDRDLWTLSAAARWTFSRPYKPPTRASRAGAGCVNAHLLGDMGRHYRDERPPEGAAVASEGSAPAPVASIAQQGKHSGQPFNGNIPALVIVAMFRFFIA
ncbi:hypothetical protein ACVW1C_005789 [Bradyrhizobium sp. USDA 4011]